MDEAFIVTVLILAAPVFWMVLAQLISRLGGWNALAEHYRAQDSFEGQRWRFESGRFGRSARYGGCLTFGANARGMYLSTLILIRPGHPPLFIPWEDITIEKTTFWHFPYAELRFRREPNASLQVREKLGQHLAAAAGLPWPPPQARPE